MKQNKSAKLLNSWRGIAVFDRKKQKEQSLRMPVYFIL